MSALRAKTAILLLERISEQERPAFIRDVIRSLDAESSNADIGLAAVLWKLHPDSETQTGIVSHIQQMIQKDHADRVAALCRDHSELEQEVIRSVIPHVASAANALRVNSSSAIAVPVCGPLQSNPTENPNETIESATTLSKQLLGYLNRIAFKKIESTQMASLLQSCLILVGAVDKKVSQLARESLFALFDLPRFIGPKDQENIWKRIQSLAASEDKYYQSLAFSLWLRWLSQPVQSDILQDPGYWGLIVNGLRQGDSERRKSALQILRASINASIDDPITTSMIVAHSQQSPPTPQTVQKQYHRFASTFETIILGRYLNQVIECEADLDFLSSSQSVVKPIFLYTLLASALDEKLQDSNRKYIGTWIMRSSLRADDADEFMDFLRSDFLPWVSAGTLFTSTLGKQGGVLRSQHGENLAQYVSNLLTNYPQRASSVIDCVLDSLLGRHGNNFAYAMVYLVEGIGRALESSADLKPTVEQLEKLHRLVTYSGLPEVVRDYALARCWKLCFNAVQSPVSGVGPNDIIKSAANSWEELQVKSYSIGPMASARTDGSIASLALQPSKREVNEQIALEKCQELVDSIDNSLNDAKLQDIWGDLEYLEYPKGLLTALPELILHPKVIQTAIAAAPGDESLRSTLAIQTKSIMELADSRSYLLPPLAGSIRTVTFQYPASAQILNVDDLIIHMAGHPPTPTMDALLEEATINLLQPIDRCTAKFGYEFYSGRRESYGFAALIDLASRLDRDCSRTIFDTLSQRWVKQKTPVPSVSHWKTSMQLQIMLLCAERVTMDITDATRILDDLHYILSIEPLPTYRYLIEWMIARIYIRQQKLQAAILKRLSTKDHHSNPKFLASLMKIGVMIAKTESSGESFALQLATTLVPLAASSKVIIRHEAQWQVPILLDHGRKMDWVSVTGNSALVALDEYIRSLERFDDPPLERQIDRLDPIKDHNLTHLVSGRWWELDQVEQPHCSHTDFLDLYANDEAEGITLPASVLPLGPPPASVLVSSSEPLTIISGDNTTAKTARNIQSIAQTLSSSPSTAIALQTKGAAYLSNTRARHSNLLVIASLVDNPYNLGGLSRVSEIFGAGSLYVTNPQVTSAKDFVSVSVSSHHHIPILPLAEDAIAAFVAAKKEEEGFSVVGIEQTDRSVILGEKTCVLPKKCILVMGSEREGIPATVLSECDVLVEIAQIGLTRSLNVQTAAGIVLCEYARQHKR